MWLMVSGLVKLETGDLNRCGERGRFRFLGWRVLILGAGGTARRICWVACMTLCVLTVVGSVGVSIPGVECLGSGDGDNSPAYLLGHMDGGH